MIEYLGQEYLKEIWYDLAKVIINLANNNDHAIRQAACYGIGIFSQHTKENYDIYVENFVSAINLALTHVPEDEEDENDWGMAKDNAVASLGKMIKYQNESVILGQNLPGIINIWLKNLPILYDSSEWEEQHEFLCDIFINRPDLILGESCCNLPSLVRLLGKIHKTKRASAEINKKIEKIFEMIKNNENWKEIAVNTYSSSEKKVKIKLEKLLG
jgi:hypothetical protein